MENDFIKFCETNKTRLCSIINHTHKRISPEMKKMDFRADIGDFFCWSLLKEFPNKFENKSGSVGHDLIFLPTKDRISIKSQEKIFENKKTRSQVVEKTKPKKLMIKNLHGPTRDHYGPQDFDYLLALQHYHQNEQNHIGFATVDFITVKNMLRRDGDQLCVTFNNRDWDYFSGIEIFISFDINKNKNEERYNNIYINGKTKIFQKLWNS